MTKVIYEALYEGTESQVPERSHQFEDKQIFFFLVQVFLLLFKKKKNDKATITTTTTKTKQTKKPALK